jgi:hypothetical protein
VEKKLVVNQDMKMHFVSIQQEKVSNAMGLDCTCLSEGLHTVTVHMYMQFTCKCCCSWVLRHRLQ